ncbi:hypothetical protein HDU87_005709 [Geranomyces variabilis]|uniref:FHA domain-containing protein n=1 Tax=Geranomyces variabilis TaxID=109894 RepID=A0AAD5TI60_9FUNG|nr:hypothetical protein HDU87_005709 [Geranomyces variabilis]
MWVLRGDSEQYAGVSLRLRPNRPLTVGRKVADLILPNEKSVSRNHAVFVIKADDADAVRAQTDPNFRYSVTLCDAGAKFGTYLNGRNRQVVEEIVNDGDVVLFGTGTASFRLTWIPVVLTASGLRTAERNQTKALVRKYDICFVDTFSPACTHLVSQTIKRVNIKVVSSLLNGCHIVTPAWVHAFENVDPNSFALPPESDFQPAIAEDSGGVGLEPQHLPPNPERKRVLQGCQFVVFGQIEGLAGIVEGAGGSFTTWELPTHSSDETLIAGRLKELQHPCVVAPPDATAEQLALLQRVMQTAGLKLLEMDDAAKAVIFVNRDRFCLSRVESVESGSQGRPHGSLRDTAVHAAARSPRPVTPPIDVERSLTQSQRLHSSQEDILSILFGDDPPPPPREPSPPPQPSAAAVPKPTSQRISLASQLRLGSRSARRIESQQRMERDASQAASPTRKRAREDDASQMGSQSQLDFIGPPPAAKRLRESPGTGISAAAPAVARPLHVPTVKTATPPLPWEVPMVLPLPPQPQPEIHPPSPPNHETEIPPQPNQEIHASDPVPPAIMNTTTAEGQAGVSRGTLAAPEPAPLPAASTSVSEPERAPEIPPAAGNADNDVTDLVEEPKQLTIVVTAPLRRQAVAPVSNEVVAPATGAPNFKRFTKTRNGPPSSEAEPRNGTASRRLFPRRKRVGLAGESYGLAPRASASFISDIDPSLRPEYDPLARERAMDATDYGWVQQP